MNKFNTKLVLDYINGNDIEEYDIDELENNSKFMKLVIECTNDKNIYYLCSDDVKKDYLFVKFIIEKFNKDYDFITKVADYYLESIDKEDITNIELNIIMHNIIGNKKDMKYAKYSLLSASNFEYDMIVCESMATSKNKDELGVGFIYIIDKYESSQIIKKYYAKKMLDTILYDYIDLEKLIHKNFKSFDALENRGVNNFFIDYIISIDNELGMFVQTNIDLIDEHINRTKKIKYNWENYEMNYNKRKLFVFHSEIIKCINNYEDLLSVNYFKVVKYIMEKLKLEKYFKKYDLLFYDTIINEIDDEFEFDNIKSNISNINESRFLDEILEISKNILIKDLVDMDPNDYNRQVKIRKKSKIIEFNQ